MKKKKRVMAILPAYNAAGTIAAFVSTLPKNVFDEIIVVDDASSDETYTVAKKIRGILLYKNPVNLGYGGNLKMCLGLALEHGADIIMELHPDGEYGTDGIIPAIEKVNNGTHLVLGNRFITRPKGMHTIKIIMSKLLSMLDNMIFKTSIPDMHQGFRVYTKKLLETVNYRSLSNTYLFSYEIITAAIQNKCSVDWVPVTARYRGAKRGASWSASVRYTIGTFYVRILYGIGFYTQKKGEFSLRYDQNCQIAFTSPVPKDMTLYYPKTYWSPPGILGWVKKIVFRVAQQRRIRWVRQYIQSGDVLDVGSGSGMFGKQLGRNFSVTNIDPYYQGEGVIKKDVLTWKTTKKFDAIVFWESLEHVADPIAYIMKARSLLVPGGLLFVEYPRYGCFESLVFGEKWFHLDIPRHLIHFTDIGLKRMLVGLRYDIVRQSGVWAFDYAPWGLIQNAIFFPIAVIIEWILYCFGQSPIGIVIAKKDANL